MSISSSLVQQLARPVSAAVVDLVPLVQGGCCRSEHDEKLLLKAQTAHPRGWFVLLNTFDTAKTLAHMPMFFSPLCTEIGMSFVFVDLVFYA